MLLGLSIGSLRIHNMAAGFPRVSDPREQGGTAVSVVTRNHPSSPLLYSVHYKQVTESNLHPKKGEFSPTF